jgi:hypothetical protein
MTSPNETEEQIWNLFGNGCNNYHAVDGRSKTYSLVKDDLEDGLQSMKESVRKAENYDDFPQRLLEDMKEVVELAEEVSEGGEKLESAQLVFDAFSFGLNDALNPKSDWNGYEDNAHPQYFDFVAGENDQL